MQGSQLIVTWPVGSAEQDEVEPVKILYDPSDLAKAALMFPGAKSTIAILREWQFCVTRQEMCDLQDNSYRFRENERFVEWQTQPLWMSIIPTHANDNRSFGHNRHRALGNIELFALMRKRANPLMQQFNVPIALCTDDHDGVSSATQSLVFPAVSLVTHTRLSTLIREGKIESQGQIAIVRDVARACIDLFNTLQIPHNHIHMHNVFIHKQDQSVLIDELGRSEYDFEGVWEGYDQFPQVAPWLTASDLTQGNDTYCIAFLMRDVMCGSTFANGKAVDRDVLMDTLYSGDAPSFPVTVHPVFAYLFHVATEPDPAIRITLHDFYTVLCHMHAIGASGVRQTSMAGHQRSKVVQAVIDAAEVYERRHAMAERAHQVDAQSVYVVPDDEDPDVWFIGHRMDGNDDDFIRVQSHGRHGEESRIVNVSKDESRVFVVWI